MTLENKQIETIVGFFANQPVLKAYIFGSYGRGEGTSKKTAEQKAASEAAGRLGLLGSDELNLDSASD